MKTLKLFALAMATVVLVRSGAAADSAFHFDDNGNLQWQTPATLAAPQIVAQPQSQIAEPGELASFFVVVKDVRNLTYQWRFNGTNLAGATGDALLLTNVTVANEGLYTVVLVNNSGSVTSAPAALMLDTDGDSLADSWELTYFGNLMQNPFGDADGDGSLNQTEFLDGTNPTNSASAQFQLTLMSDGGQVTASPTKLSYTNGELVTVTATAFSSEVFHGWTGAFAARTNVLSLVMTNSKTLFAHFQAAQITWAANISGSWHNPSNWNPTLVPTEVDDVTLPYNVAVTLNEAAACRHLALTTGTLTGNSNLTVYGNFLWTGGTMDGSGRTIIAPGANLTINSPFFTMSLARTLENGGTTVWTGAPGINVNNVVITNRAGALFEVQTAPTFGSGGGAPRFDNAGTFRKSTNSGTVTFNMPFNNYGEADLQVGTLLHNSSFVNNGSVALAAGTTHRIAGGGSGNGSFNAPATALVDSFGTFTLSTGAQLNGMGIYRINGTLNCDADFAVQNAELNGNLAGSGAVTISNTMSWTGGTLSGSGRTIIAPGATFTISSPFFTMNLNRTLENGGTTVWTGSGGVNVNNVAITNRPGGLFDVQIAVTLGSGGGAPRFDNAGTFRKSSNAGTMTFASGVPLNNYGLVESLAGTLTLNGGGSHIGSFVVSNGTALSFGGTHNFSAVASIVGAGNINVNSGVFTHSGLANVTGINSFSGGTANLNGNYICTNNTIAVSGGVANFNGTGLVSPATVTLTAGSLGGSSLVTVLEQMNWSSGSMDGSGRTVIAPSATLTISSPAFTLTLSRLLENAGTVIWTGSAGMNVNNVAITNRAGALFQAPNALTMGSAGGTPRFDNAGVFRKSTNGGTTTFNFPFNNYGSVEVQAGTLLHNNSLVNSGSVALAAGTVHRMASGGSAIGTFTNAATALVDWAGGTFTLNAGAQLNGVGLYRINATLVCNPDLSVTNLDLSGTLDGPGIVTVQNVMNWYGGTMSGSGRTVIPSGATLNAASSPFTVNLNTRVLENGGTILWTGAGINLSSTFITNRVGALFHAQNAQSLTGGGSVRFDNAGTFRKSVSAGTTFLGGGMPFNNYGSIEVQTGTLYFVSSFSNNGAATLAAGTALQIAAGGSATGMFTNPPTALVEWLAGAFTLNTGAKLNGAGLYRISATLVCNPDLSVTNLDLNGTLDGPGVVTVHNAMNWYGGTMSGSGRTVIPTNATLNVVSSPFTVNLNSRVLENGGTVLWTGAGINVNSTLITNRSGALFHAQNAQSLTGGGSSRFDNAGTFRKSVSTGTTFLGGGLPFNNYGTVEVQTGTLYSSSSFLNNGVVTLAGGTAHQIAAGGSATGTFTNPPTSLIEWLSGGYTLNPSAELNGGGLYRINNATLVCNADLSVTNLDLNGTLDGSGIVTVHNVMNWNGGTMSGSGQTVISTGATLNAANSPFTAALSRTLENGGTVLSTAAAGINVNNVVITNRVGALFHVLNTQSLNFSGGTPRFDNAGTFRKSANSGTVFLGIPFNNYGTVDLRSGIVAVNGGYTAAPGSSLNCVLGGTSAGTGYGQLQKSGVITLDGALSVELLPGFQPATNDTFSVVSAGTRSGTFSSFAYPSNRLVLTLSNSPSAVILRATGVFPVPLPILLAPELVGANAKLVWTATSNVTYRLEYNPSLSSTNWFAVVGDVTTPSNTASKLDLLTSSNRFYRVRVLP